MRSAFLLLTTILAASADDSEDIRAVLRGFNEAARKPDPQAFRPLFAAQADYRDAVQTAKGSDALISLFSSRQLWSERTHPTLQDESIRVVGRSVAFVDAQFVQHGSIIIKSAVPVVLLLEKEADRWKISSWRMLACGISLPAP